jgi:hypothetical protein
MKMDDANFRTLFEECQLARDEAGFLGSVPDCIRYFCAENALLSAQNEWLKDRISDLQLPANSQKNIEEWLSECGMPTATATATADVALLEVAKRILDRGYVSESIAEERSDHQALVAAIAKSTASQA